MSRKNSKWRREFINPMDIISSWYPDEDVSHITYDPNMKASDREYWRIEQCGGDGTLTFTLEMLNRLLIPLLEMSTHYKPTAPKDWSKVLSMKYTIGKIRHVTVFGCLELRCGGTYPGQRERVRMPVRCEYILNN